jgi:hypothetical protein
MMIRSKTRNQKNDDVRVKLIEYIELQEQLYKRDKCGLSWALLKQTALLFAKNLGHDDFKAGDSFIHGALKSGNK